MAAVAASAQTYHDHPHDIFLSHSGKQKGFVRDLHESLSSIGYSIFFDADSLPPGQQPFPSRLLSAAESCKIAIVVLSDDFVTSRWPMIELCVFADRLAEHLDHFFTLVPLFLKLAPEDLKRKEKVKEWRMVWERFEQHQQDGRSGRLITAAKCEEAVTKILRERSGIVRQCKSEQGEASYIRSVTDTIASILPRPRQFTMPPNHRYSGRERLCNIILDNFKELEVKQDHLHDSNKVSILGMYGVSGSGKSTLCSFLCESMFDEFRGYVFYLELPTKTDSDDIFLLSKLCADILSKFTPRLLYRDIASMDLNKLLNLLRKSGFGPSFSMYIPFVFEQIGILLREMCKFRGLKEWDLEQILKIVSEGKKEAMQKLVSTNFQHLPEELQVLFFDIALFIIPAGYSNLEDATLILTHMHHCNDTFEMQMKINKLRRHCSLSIISNRLRIHDIFIEYAKSLPENAISYIHLINKPSTNSLQVLQLKCAEARTIVIGSKSMIQWPRTVVNCSKSMKQWPRTVVNGSKSMAQWPFHCCKICNATVHVDHQDAHLHLEMGASNATVDDHLDLHLHLEMGAKAKALVVRNSSYSTNCSLVLSLSGDLSSLVCLDAQNVEQVAISLSATTGAELSNLVIMRLEVIRNEECETTTCSRSGQEEKKACTALIMRSFKDLILNPLENCKQSLGWWLSKPWQQSLRPVQSCLETSRQMTGLRVLKLINSGIQSLENIGRYFPQLEDLEVSDEKQELMLLSTGNAPKLKKFIIGPSFSCCTNGGSLLITGRIYHREIYKPTKSSKLVLQLRGCPELHQLHIDVCSFDQVEIEGALPSTLRDFSLANNNRVEAMPTTFISPAAIQQQQLSLLERLTIFCNQVETLDFTQQYCLPSLNMLKIDSCNNLRHISVDPNCLPNLETLLIYRCQKLQVIEGLENLVKDAYAVGKMKMYFNDLPHLQCDLKFSICERLREISVRRCPGVKIDFVLRVWECCRDRCGERNGDPLSSKQQSWA